MKRGKLIVIEGIDGAGKTTQIDIIAENLKKHAIPYEVISFPRYEDNVYGQLIKRYLVGEFGGFREVNPYLIALAYAGDRALAKPEIKKWLSEGRVVLVNRYVSSSKAHLGANLPEDEREKFINWLDELEYGTNKMPQPDLTILLDVDPKIGQKNVLDKQKPDLHEESFAHLEGANGIFLKLASAGNHWAVVDCMEDEKMKDIEDIHREIMKVIQNLL